MFINIYFIYGFTYGIIMQKHAIDQLKLIILKLAEIQERQLEEIKELENVYKDLLKLTDYIRNR